MSARALTRGVLPALVAVAVVASLGAAAPAAREAAKAKPAGREAAPRAPRTARSVTSRPAPNDKRPKLPRTRQRLDVEPLAIVGADIEPVTSEPVPGGTLLLRDGRIEAILAAGRPVPSGYRVLSAAGRRAYPGLVAAGAAGIGLNYDAADGDADGALGRPLGDSFNPWADDVDLAASAGITSALVYRAALDPSGPIGGMGAVLKMSVGEPRGVVLKDPAAVLASSLLLTPAGRTQAHELFSRARREPPSRGDAGSDPAAVTLHDLVQGRLPLFASPASAADVLAFLDVAKAERVRPVIYLSTEAWVVADQVAAAKADVVQHSRLTWFKPRANRRTLVGGGWRYDAPAVLTHAGVRCAVGCASDAVQTWGVAGRDLLNLPLEAAFAQRGGLTPQQAIESITIVPARILGVADRVGSLEVGKDADIILTDGDLLDYRTFVRTTIVNGRVAYEAKDDRFWRGVIAHRDGVAPTHPGPAAPPKSPRSPTSGLVPRSLSHE